MVSVYSWRQEDSAGYAELFDAFSEANDGIEAKFEPYNSTDYDQILQTAITSGEPLDVIQLRPYAAGRQLMDDGSLDVLTDLPGIENFDSTMLSAATGSDGEVYRGPSGEERADHHVQPGGARRAGHRSPDDLARVLERL